jgi:hypothetical protein
MKGSVESVAFRIPRTAFLQKTGDFPVHKRRPATR